MSNAVWPVTRGLGWSVFKVPSMSTLLKQAVSGKETRLQLWQNPIWEFRLTYEFLGDGFKGNNDLNTLIDFYLSRKGAFDSFLYDDPTDDSSACVNSFVNGSLTSGVFQAAESVIQSTSGAQAVFISQIYSGRILIGAITGTADASHTWVGQVSGAVFTPSATPTVYNHQLLGVGDGTTARFQLQRPFLQGGFSEAIQAPNIVSNVYQNIAIMAANTYSIDSQGGIVFVGGSIPAANVIVAADFTYYFRVRFGSIAGNAQAKDGDSLEFENFMNQLWQLKQVSFVSAKL